MSNFIPHFPRACDHLSMLGLKLIHVTKRDPWKSMILLYYMSITWQLMTWWFNTLRPRRNEQHFADDIFKRIFFNENVWISIKILLKFVPKGPINNIPALVQIMAWRRSGNKPLFEPMMVILPTHICVTRPQWVKEPGGRFNKKISSYQYRKPHCGDKQRVLMHRHQGLNVRHGLCHIYMRYLYIYELFIAFVCFVVCSLL